MFHDIIRLYADVIYVATTLRLPVSARPAHESERFADCEERRQARSSGRVAGWIARWWRVLLGRAGSPTAKPAPRTRASFIRAPHP